MKDWSESWRKKTKDGKIIMMRDHNWAFAAWEISLLNNIIKPGAILVHVDSHLDDIPELACEERYYQVIKDEEAAKFLATPIEYGGNEQPDYMGMKIENFIWPSILRDTIDYLYHVSDDNLEELKIEDIYDEILIHKDMNSSKSNSNSYITKKIYEKIKGKDKKVFRCHSVEEFIKEFPSNSISSTNRSLILDLDLDYFNDSDYYNDYPNLKSDLVIKKNLMDLKNLYKWDLITMALSPEHCGGIKATQHLLDIFYEVFEINTDTLEDW